MPNQSSRPDWAMACTDSEVAHPSDPTPHVLSNARLGSSACAVWGTKSAKRRASSKEACEGGTGLGQTGSRATPHAFSTSEGDVGGLELSAHQAPLLKRSGNQRGGER